MRLSLYEFETGAETIGGDRVIYDIANDTAHFGAAEVEGHALVWQLDETPGEAEGALLSRSVQLDPFADWVMRCDRVDFPPGGIAYTHTHPGPGIRYLLHGELDITSEGKMLSYGRAEPGSSRAPIPCSQSPRSTSQPRSFESWCCPRSGPESARSGTSTRLTTPARSSRRRPSSASTDPSPLR